MREHDTNKHRRAIETARTDWQAQYMTTGGGALAAVAYMAEHDYTLDESVYVGTRASVAGDVGDVTVEIDDAGNVDVYVKRNGVYIWGASASELAPRSLALDMIQLAEMSAKVAGQPALRKATQPAHRSHASHV